MAGTSRTFKASLREVARVLSTRVPLAELATHRVTTHPLSVSLVAVEPSEAERTDSLASATAEQLVALASWVRAGRVEALRADGAFGDLFGTLPGVEVLAGSFAPPEGPSAVVIARMRPGAHIESDHLEAFRHAIGPLRVAWERAERAGELLRLREVLAMDRQASSTQRQEITDVIIGEASGLRDVMERVELVAATDTPVLILGETGSGKEVIARAIHVRSSRSQGPVVRVNCGAIPPELVDSELFGHEKGSFTGAVASRQGWFERASGGTLFLDEVGELPLAAQVRLLRVLQDGTLERVGGHKTLRVDVRVVAATHRNLEAMVADKSFREDLWYRLNIFPIKLPALRDRLQDVPALVRHFAAHAGARVGNSDLRPTDEDVARLRRYSWPGNVRELAAVIERAAILGNGRRLDVSRALGAADADGGSNLGGGTLPPSPVAHAKLARPLLTLDEMVKHHIERALAVTQGRIEGRLGAAQLLGINPHTLRAKMRKLKIDWVKFRPDGLAT